MFINKEKIEYMDVDMDGSSSEVQICNGEKRRVALTTSDQEDIQFVPLTNSVVGNVNLKTSSRLPRQILKAKRSILNGAAATNNSGLILVLDTNILVEDLNILKQLISNLDSPSSKSNNLKLSIRILKFIIPWTVIQELDGLKKDSNRIAMKKATNAIKFIHEQLEHGGNKHRLVCLKPSPRSGDSQLPCTNNDDRILQCCLELSHSQLDLNASSSSSSLVKAKCENVTLITNDQNLQNKALVFQVKCCNLKELIHRYSVHQNLFAKKNSLSKLSNTSSYTSETSDKIKTVKSHDVSNGVKIDTSTSVCLSSRNNIKRLKSSNLLSSTSLDASSFGQKFHCAPMDSRIVTLTSFKTPTNLDLKYALEIRLAEFVVATFKETFGDQVWKDVLGNEYHQDNASLLDSLRKLKSNWIGVFSDYFQRDRKVLDLINEMILSKRNRSQENYEKLMNMIDKAKKKCTKRQA